ncbi:MAG: hypothetical protein PVI30_15100 [Myxococcales bacterium]|jgi:hypothetical protein
MTTTRTFTLALFTWLALSLGACGDRNPRASEHLDLRAVPVALGEGLLFVDEGHDRGFLLEADGGARAAEIPLPHDPRNTFQRLGVDEALALSFGRRATQEEEPEPAALTAVQPDGTTRTYELGNPFDTVRQSPDGRYALLFKSGRTERLLDNPNEIAIVDLEADPEDDDAVTLRTLRSFGDSPVNVFFSPPMPIVGEMRRLAVIVSMTNVTLLDLDHLDRRETTVRLSSPGSTPVQPAQVVFSEEEPVLYVRGDRSDDIFVFNLSERVDGVDDADEGEDPRNDFRPFINQLGVGNGPTDMTIYETDDGPRLLVLAPSSQQVALVEAGTSQVTTIPLGANASRVLLFEGPAPGDDQVRRRALLYHHGNTVVTFLDLEDAEQRGTRNLEELALEQGISALIDMGDENQVLALHGTEGVSLIDLAQRTVSPISANVVLQDAIFDAERGRLWVGPSGQPWVGLLDLDTGKTDEVLLDAPIRHLVPVFAAGRMAAVHDSDIGHVTWLDADDPRRETARAVEGFVLEDLLDQGE